MNDSALSVAPAVPGAPADGLEVYDFGRSATLSREHARTLEAAFETFARQWAAQLSTSIRARTHVTVEGVEMQTYDEYAHSLPATTTLVVCALPDSDARLIVQFPLTAATGWIMQMVGGRVTETPEDRVLTAIEQSLVRSVMHATLENLTHALGGLLPEGASVASIQYSPHFAQVAAASAPVIVAHLSMRVSAMAVPVTVMLPAAMVQAGLDTSGIATTATPPGLMRRQVEEAPVELALRLSARTVRPAEVLQLSVGDVLAVPHSADRPLDLVVGEHVVATAAAGSSGARLACIVTAVVSDPVEESA